MDLKDFLVRFNPGILKSYDREKEKLQPPKSAPGNQVFTQQLKATKFPFPPYSPSSPTPSNASIDLLEVIPETPLESTPSEPSTQMSSPLKVIPETQSLSQSPEMILPSLSHDDMIQFGNRIEFEFYQE